MKCISPGLPRLSPFLHRCQLFPPLFAVCQLYQFHFGKNDDNEDVQIHSNAKSEADVAGFCFFCLQSIGLGTSWPRAGPTDMMSMILM